MTSVLSFVLPSLAVLALVSGCTGADEDGAVASASGEKASAIETSSPETSCVQKTEPVRIEGGTFTVGSEGTYPEEGPAQEVTIGAFRIEPVEVTVARFRAFVEATGYVTVAERPVDPVLLEGYNLSDAERDEFLSPGGAVFRPMPGVAPNGLNWWKYVPGASWQYPQGPDHPPAQDNEPVTQIAFEDAAAFAEWAGGRLPTEAEWEVAATAGDRSGNTSTKAPENANTWQGIFPMQNTGEDGYEGVAPVGCFAPNAFGLHDMLGNVWEWTADPYTAPRDSEAAMNGAEGEAPARRTIKGGSFLCANNYCMRYRPSARQAQDTGMGTNHIGIRVVYDD